MTASCDLSDPSPAAAHAAAAGGPPPGAALRWRAALLVLLTFGAGTTDVVGFLGMEKVFTANMTGNIVLFGLAAGEGNGADLARCGAATLAFALGLLAGFLIAGRTPAGRVWPPRVTAVLGFVLALQTAFLAGWAATGAEPHGGGLLALISLSSVAMGAQTAAARSMAADGITTTFVTGTLTSMMGGLAVGRGAAAGLRTAVILGLAAGAAVAGALMTHAPVAAAAVSPAVLAAVVAGAFRLHSSRTS
ncbi:YoaK family protein [Actinomadura luteofluorescens]|uniref:YoaK family protein n=1 Tax=Actinomadura luteofluorescens TaxID=46163 RepID=UPI003484AFC8